MPNSGQVEAEKIMIRAVLAAREREAAKDAEVSEKGDI